jgi:lipopolysaccharide/colanic/teichoic acid biosynthesis glycosyltransferase
MMAKPIRFSEHYQVVFGPIAAVKKRVPIWYDRFESTRKLTPEAYEPVKRAMDILISVLALPFILPVILLCAIAIRLDTSGPIFFFQNRTGQGGKRFKMWKMRTMVQNAEELKSKYMHLNELTWPDFKITNDPRMTWVGRILRKTSLDELPQIFNVLNGDMSWVGPRPTSFSSDTYQLWHTARLEMKPGITGLWQILGRNELDFDERLRLDIAYMRNQSLVLDLLILVGTVGSVFTGRGAN